MQFFKNEYELNYYIQSFPKPYLSIWNGIVMGGGVGLSIYGDYRIATTNTKFAMPESTIGFFPDVGSSYFLSRMKNNIGLYTNHIFYIKAIYCYINIIYICYIKYIYIYNNKSYI